MKCAAAVAAHLGPLADELDSWGIRRWSPLGEKVLDSPINWKPAVDTFAENYHFATVHVHRQTFATIARSNCTVFDSYADLESGARDHLLVGRNEPRLQHRHISWDQAIAAAESAVAR